MYTGEYENLEIEGPTNIDNKKEKKSLPGPTGARTQDLLRDKRVL